MTPPPRAAASKRHTDFEFCHGFSPAGQFRWSGLLKPLYRQYGFEKVREALIDLFIGVDHDVWMHALKIISQNVRVTYTLAAEPRSPWVNFGDAAVKPPRPLGRLMQTGLRAA
jgi:hypothetical protein